MKLFESIPFARNRGQIQDELLELKAHDLYRCPRDIDGLDFSSNDYLGFAQCPSIRQKLIEFLRDHPQLGSTGSRLVSGQNAMVAELESYLAEVWSAPRALILGSGYLANLGAMVALACDHAEFFSDQLNHSSLIDGMRLARSAVKVFRHNDLGHLKQLLTQSVAERKIIVTESVFSMDGDSPDLIELARLATEFGAYLVVDEAHATGVCGRKGLGLMDEIDYDIERTCIIHTCGKSLGSYGAFITTSSALAELIINKARTFIYSTALPSYVLAHIKFAVERSITDALPR